MGIVQRQGLRNAVISYAGILLGALSLLVVQPHFLGKEEIGLVRVLFSFSALVSAFMPLGMQAITLKYFPYFRDRDKGHYGFFLLVLFVPLVGFLLIGGGIWTCRDLIMSQYKDQSALLIDYFYYVFPLTLFLTYVSVLTSYSYSIFRTSVPVMLNDVLVRLVSIALFSLYFIHVLDRNGMVFWYVTIYGGQMLFLLIYIFVIDNPSLRVDYSFFKEQKPRQMLKYGLLLSFVSVSSLGLKNIDIVFLGKFVPLGMVGIYSVAVFVPTVIEAPLMALEKIGLPKIADAWARNNRDEILEIYSKSSRYLFLAGSLLFLGINLNTESLLSMMPDKDYSKGVSVIFLISLGTLMNMATGINDSILFTSEKYVYGTYLLIVLFIVAVVNNLIFIPLFGINGAALATAISAVVFNGLKLWLIKRSFGLQPWDVRTAKILFITIICFCVVYPIPHLESAWLDIVFRSLLILTLFLSATWKLRIVQELHPLLQSYLRKVIRKKIRH